MVKQKHNDGFTLIEMLVVLLMVSMMLLLYPTMRNVNTSMLSAHMETFKTRLLMIQQSALLEKKRMDVSLLQNTMVVNGEMEYIPVSCYQQFSFNESGNVSRAMSITCSLNQQQKTLVIQLGSGRMYVK